MNWQRGISTALMGVGANYQNNYDRYREEQSQIAKENRMYETTMRKEKELYARQQERETLKQQSDIQSLMEQGWSEEEATMQIKHGGIETKDDAVARKLDESTQIASAQAEAKMDVANAATAAQEQKITGILAKYEGEGAPTQMSATDKAILAINGYKVPEQKQEKMSDTVIQKYHAAAQKNSMDLYGNPDTFPDENVLNTVQAEFQKRGAQVPNALKDPVAARQWLIDMKTQQGYIVAISTVTGGPPAQTPDGQQIGEQEVAEAIAEAPGSGGPPVAGGGPPGMPGMPLASQGSPQEVMGGAPTQPPQALGGPPQMMVPEEEEPNWGQAPPLDTGYRLQDQSRLGRTSR